jgi:hypothetical protein
MSERETFPSERALLDAREEQAELRTHVAYPGRVQSYDPATQTADVVPLVRQQVPQPDGSHALEALPVVPSVPVLWPRVGGWFLAFQLRPGDTVQLLCNTSAIGHWRAGQGDVTDPGDLRRQHLAHAVALPGLYTRGRALGHAPTGDDELTLGSDAGGGTRLTFKTDGTLTVTRGSTVRLQLDPDGTVHLGGTAGEQFLALANLVDALFNGLKNMFTTWVPVPHDGGAALKTLATTWCATVSSVAASRAKGS